jgi:hypothetical protein
MSRMRAKMRVSQVQKFENSEILTFNAVGKSGSYPSDGSDEDNTYSKFTPSAKVEIHVANPALIGQFQPGQTYFVDFTPAEDVKAIPGPHEPPRPPGSHPVA